MSITLSSVFTSLGSHVLEAFLVSTGLVAVAEIGDKTQLLAFILAAKFRRPMPIIWGILVATLLNHGLAGVVGTLVAQNISPEVLRWVLGAAFIVMGIWTLVPDKLSEEEAKIKTTTGVFITTLVAFFLAEMGDKTQIATVALAAHYLAPLAVVVGTTLGMMIANVPAVILGNKLAGKLPLQWVRVIAATILVTLGCLVLLGVGQS